MCVPAAEKEYDTSYFHHQVQRIHIDDHNVPKFTYAPHPVYIQAGI